MSSQILVTPIEIRATVATLINAPTPENQQAAAQTIEQARQALDVVQHSRWLITVTVTANKGK